MQTVVELNDYILARLRAEARYCEFEEFKTVINHEKFVKKISQD